MKTLATWNSKYRMIRKGEQASGRSKHGLALFKKSQTVKMTEGQIYWYKGGIVGEENIYYADNTEGFDPDPMDYDLGLCGQT